MLLLIILRFEYQKFRRNVCIKWHITLNGLMIITTENTLASPASLLCPGLVSDMTKSKTINLTNLLHGPDITRSFMFLVGTFNDLGSTFAVTVLKVKSYYNWRAIMEPGCILLNTIMKPFDVVARKMFPATFQRKHQILDLTRTVCCISQIACKHRWSNNAGKWLAWFDPSGMVVIAYTTLCGINFK